MTASEQGQAGSANATSHLLASVCALILAAVLIFPLAYTLHQSSGLWAAGAALLVVSVAAITSHFIAMMFPDPKAALVRVGSGFLIRMGAPLIYCLIIVLQEGALAEANSHFFCFGFYAAVMLAEVVLLAKTQHPVSLAKNSTEPLQNRDGENTAT